MKKLLLILLLFAASVIADSFGSTSDEAAFVDCADEDTRIGRFQMGGTGGDTDSIRIKIGDDGGTSKIIPVIYYDDSDDPTTLLKAFTNDTITVVSGVTANYVVDVSGDAYTLVADTWYWIGFHVAVEGNDLKMEKSASQDPHRRNVTTGNVDAPDPAGGTAYALEGPDIQIFYTTAGGSTGTLGGTVLGGTTVGGQ